MPSASVTLEARLEQAKALREKGAHQLAEEIYQELIDEGCTDPRPYNNLALMPGLSDNDIARMRWLRKALELDPLHTEARMNLAVLQHNRCQSKRAIENLRKALQQKPDNPDILGNLSHVLIEIGELQEAKKVIEQAILSHPWHNQIQFHYGNYLASTGRYEEAINHFQTLITKAPSTAATDALAQCLLASGEVEEAQKLYHQQLNENPNDISSLLGLSRLLIDSGNPSEGLNILFYLLTIEPSHTEALLLNGHALQTLGENDSAIKCFEQLLEANPTDHKALNYLGICLWEIGELDRAADCFQRALAKQRNIHGILCNLAATYRGRGRIRIAHRLYRRIIRERPNFLPGYREFLFSLSIGSEQQAQEHLQVAKAYWHTVNRLNNHQSLDPEINNQTTISTARPSGSRRLKVGIISGDIGFHCVSTFLTPILRNIDKSQFQLQLIIPDRRYDSRSREIMELADQCLQIDGISTTAAAERLREQNYDIILETSGFTRSTGIDMLSPRCAPVQCHYIGFHASTGMPEMDYFIGDEETVPSEFAPQFSEQLWALPRPWLACEPYAALPQAQTITDNPRPIFGCFNQLAKVRDATLLYWASAMRRIPGSGLLIKDRLTGNDSVRRRIIGRLGELGIDSDRIEFLPKTSHWSVHLEYYNLIDIALDTTPWSSATTGFDALGMGVPLIAIRGGCTSARMSSALVKGLGRPEWLAETPEAYADAVEACLGSLAQLRAGKQERQQQALASPLFDSVDMTRHLERAMLTMLERCS